MPKVEAVHRIERAIEPGKDATATSRAVPPKVIVINPGETFTVEGDEYEELKALGAIKKPTPKGEQIDHDEEAKRAGLDPSATKVTEGAAKAPRQTAKGTATAKAKAEAKAGKPAEQNDGTGNDPGAGEGENGDNDLI